MRVEPPSLVRETLKAFVSIELVRESRCDAAALSKWFDNFEGMVLRRVVSCDGTEGVWRRLL